jgi:glutathione S-transferase
MLEESGVAWREEALTSARLQKAARTISPTGNLPVLQDGDVVVAQPEAILTYVEERYAPKEHLVPLQQARRDMILSFALELQRTLWSAEFYHAETLSDRELEEQKGLFIRDFVVPALSFLTRLIGARDYALGDIFTRADCALVAALDAVDKNLPRALPAFPEIKKYLKRCHARPAISRLMAEGRRL